jgi:hypothetical protein
MKNLIPQMRRSLAAWLLKEDVMDQPKPAIIITVAVWQDGRVRIGQAWGNDISDRDIALVLKETSHSIMQGLEGNE